ncbi:MAG: type II toxin-antitoxin system RelE family toxin [Nitrospirota bacterium]
MWRIELSRQVDKFTKKENIKDEEILSLVQKVINYSKGLNENIDVKKMKGRWKGHYRIRIGKIRMILRMDFKNKIAFIDKVDFRGDV